MQHNRRTDLRFGDFDAKGIEPPYGAAAWQPQHADGRGAKALHQLCRANIHGFPRLAICICLCFTLDLAFG